MKPGTAAGTITAQGRHPVARSTLVWCAAALALGALLRIGFILLLPYISDDSLMYGSLARNLLTRGVYGFSSTGAPSLIRLPGYPLFLALCFKVFGIGRYGAVLGVQAAVDLGSCVMMAALAGRLFGRRAGCAALWLSALCPFTANYVAAVLSETLTLFALTLSLFALERWQNRAGTGWNRWLPLIALGLGLGILLRPEQGLVAAAVIPAMFWMRLRHPGNHPVWPAAALPVIAAGLLTLLPLVPWTIRNYRTFKVFQPLAPRFAIDPGEFNPAGFQRWYRTWAIDYASTEQVYWNYDGAVISLADLPDRAFDSTAQYLATERVLNDYNATQTATPSLDLRFDQIARQRIAARPVRYYLLLPVARLLNMTFRPRDYMLPWPLEWWKFRLHPGATIQAFSYALLNLAYFVLASLTLLRRRVWAPQQPIVWAMLGTLLLRALLLLTLDNSEMRYTLEFFPVLIVLAAANFAKAPRTSQAAE